MFGRSIIGCDGHAVEAEAGEIADGGASSVPDSADGDADSGGGVAGEGFGWQAASGYKPVATSQQRIPRMHACPLHTAKYSLTSYVAVLRSPSERACSPEIAGNALSDPHNAGILMWGIKAIGWLDMISGARHQLPLPRPVPTLSGAMITLRPLDPARDARGYYEMCLEPEMHLWTGNRVLFSCKESQAELERFAEMPHVTMWAIVDNASAGMIGRFYVCLEERDGRRVAGDGNRIARPFWRKGHNREARQLVLRYVFEVLAADWYESECWTNNVNSRLSILAHGFEGVASYMQFSPKHGRPLEKMLFRMTREQWRLRQRPVG